MSMEDNAKAVCRACYFHIHNIGKIRYLIDAETTKLLIQTLILCRLDYCNALLYGSPLKLISRLQRVMNSAARLVTRTRRSEHITPILQSLHWLPVLYRIQYKIILLTHRAVHAEDSTQYLKETIEVYRPQRSLRSADQLRLAIPQTSSTMGDKAFAASSPQLWNDLPQALRQNADDTSFKTQLKTYLFTKAFN